jgi:tetraacyldisaccharide 4'-kinase
MRAPAFWTRPPGPAAWALAPFGWLFGRITSWRMGRRGAPAGLPVICIGNFTAGGAGKTPAAAHLAAMLSAGGVRALVLSRGYGGEFAGPVLVDSARHGPEDCGDEPLLLSRSAQVVVARDKVAGAAFALAWGADVLIMDDGMQNPSLSKDLVIAVVDGEAGVGNGLCMPAGPLRAPLKDQLPYAHAILVIGEGEAGERVVAFAPGKTILRGRLEPDGAALERLRGKRLSAFAGIGRPEKFFATLRAAGLDVAATRAFADHHPYTEAEARALVAEAATAGLTPVTTQKDAVRWPKHAPVVEALPVALALTHDSEQALVALVSARIPPAP